MLIYHRSCRMMNKDDMHTQSTFHAARMPHHLLMVRLSWSHQLLLRRINLIAAGSRMQLMLIGGQWLQVGDRHAFGHRH